MDGRVCALCVCFVACGPAQPAPQQQATPFVESAHAPPLPIPSNGGSVLASPAIVVVTFAGYAFADDVEAMADWIPTSHWLDAVAAEYGVGTASVLAKVRLAESAPSFSSASDFTAYVASKVGTALPPADPSTFYAFVFPAGAHFTDPSIGAMCSEFTGYHDAAADRAYTFAAIGTCPKHVAGLGDVEQVERVFSHELVEAFTNPYGDGFAARDPEDPWSYVGGGELADVCDGTTRESGFLAVRSWSNAAAAAGLDPCQPSDAAPYFNVAPSSVVVQHVRAGETVALELTGFSTDATSDWFSQGVLGARDFTPIYEVGTSTLNNDRTDELTITVPASTQTGSTALLLFRSFHSSSDSDVALQPIVIRVD